MTDSPPEPPRAARRQRVKLTDVARLAGTSPSVVSRALNGDPALRARPETRERVYAAARLLDYMPNHAARSLRLARAATIGLMVPDVTNAIFEEIVRGVDDAATELGLQVMLGRTERLQPGSDILPRLLREGRVDGFLVQRRDEVGAVEFAELIRRPMPVVLLNSRGKRPGSVVLDDAMGARVAASHLLELGHRKIALIGGDPRSYTAKQRERGFVEALSAGRLTAKRKWIIRSGYSPNDGYEAIHELVSSASERPTGVVVANINAAIGALRGARELGIQVPGEMSIIAIHDTWMAEFTSPPLTTVRMPLRELGDAAVRLLDSLMHGGLTEDLVVHSPPPLLIQRGSTAPPP